MFITQEKRVAQAYEILDRLRLPNGLYVASSSSDYNFVWLRDTFYEVLPYLDKNCDRYEQTYYRILDIFRDYEWKLDIHTKQKPVYKHEYLHPRYTADTAREVESEWGNKQHDATAAILFGIGEGMKRGKHMLRDDKDREIVQKLVQYLECVQFWEDPDNGIWEEYEEVRSSSVGACVAALKSVKGIVDVPDDLIEKGMETLYELFPYETRTRKYDLAQLTLIYPFGVFNGEMAQVIVNQTEKHLLRNNGILRYIGDSYYSTLEAEHGRGRSRSFYAGTEAEWTFGFGFLALSQLKLGNMAKARSFLERFEHVMLEDGSLPELYYANSGKFNTNTPLGWSNAMYILAKEAVNSSYGER
ncbi:glycoside hydrolase family 15 protein [Paenibacillus methanolicus]|uniref:Phosphorylase kinase alpha/beta subunit n=1 Tax=Paenibacillus methanolicus TaxID=582686 RepID=A0A5S5CBD2_9BACL|nr:glycoside hydrolase family 15 protein [Paenibacillus methanolicus]TYP76664.1 phosphorylase kinase alpha/beta subunit [Paenibacillus methanolicus]